jgi:uncharacterized protein YbaR (Trm112 family)
MSLTMITCPYCKHELELHTDEEHLPGERVCKHLAYLEVNENGETTMLIGVEAQFCGELIDGKAGENFNSDHVKFSKDNEHMICRVHCEGEDWELRGIYAPDAVEFQKSVDGTY